MRKSTTFSIRITKPSAWTSSSGFDKNFVGSSRGGGYGYNEYGDTAGASELSAERICSSAADSPPHGNQAWNIPSWFRSPRICSSAKRRPCSIRAAGRLRPNWNTRCRNLVRGGADVDFYVSERDGFVPPFSLFGERDFIRTGPGRCVRILFRPLCSTSGRARFQLSLYFERHPEHGFWFYTGLGGRFERDTVVDVYFESYGSAGYPSYAAERFLRLGKRFRRGYGPSTVLCRPAVIARA